MGPMGLAGHTVRNARDTARRGVRLYHLVRVVTPPDANESFVAALEHDTVRITRAAPVLGFMRRWPVILPQRHCEREGWTTRRIASFETPSATIFDL